MPTKDGTTPNEIGQFAETLRAIIPATTGAINLLKCYENFSMTDLNKVLNQNGETLTEGIYSLFKSMMEFEIKQDKYLFWLDKILESEKKAHLAFFGKEFDLTIFANTLQKYGKKRIQDWKKLGLEVHFIPKMSFSKSDSYSGWKIKPNDWFYENISNGKIFHYINGNLITLRTVETEGTTLLIDTRCKPQYTGGSQIYENDNFLGPIILKLRKKDKIQYGSCVLWESRFNISAYEFEIQLRPKIAELLKLNVSQIRLEKTIEANIISQMYLHMPRKNDDNTNTWVLYDEYFRARMNRLGGGNSDNGGLSDVSCPHSSNHWFYGSVRSVAVL